MTTSGITDGVCVFLHRGRRGWLEETVEFPAGTPVERIAVWRERVTANGGAVTEVYAPNPTPTVPEERMAAFRRRLAAARA